MLNNNLSKRTIYLVDIDETIFHQKNTLIYVKDYNGNVVEKLTNDQLNDHVLKPGYSYDHSEFHSGKNFVENAEPIKCSIEWLKNLILENKNLENPDMICILTARGDFDDKNLVLDFFDKQGIPIRRYKFVQFVRTGNINELIPTGQKKGVVALMCLIDNTFDKLVMVDDSITNLKYFHEVKKCSTTGKERFDIIHIIHDKVNGQNTNYQMVYVKDEDVNKYIDIYTAKRTLAKWGVAVTDKSVEHIKVGKRTKKEAVFEAEQTKLREQDKMN